MFIIRKLKQFLKKKYFPLYFYMSFAVLLSCGKTKESSHSTTSEQPSFQFSDTAESRQRNADTLAAIQGDLPVSEHEDRERNKWQKPGLVIDKLGKTQNKVIADIGAGTGYFTFPLAEVSEKVIAIDIESAFLDYIEDLKLDYPRQVSESIETRLTVENDPMLKKNEVDAVLMVNVYPYLNNRIEYLEKVKEGLKENGIILIVDFKKGGIPIGPEEELKISADTVAAELRKAGFEVEEKDEKSLDYQYIIKAQ